MFADNTFAGPNNTPKSDNETIYKNRQSRVNLKRKFRSIWVCKMLHMFNKSAVDRAIFNIVCCVIVAT